MSNPDPNNLFTTRTVSLFLVFLAAGAGLMHVASVALTESVSDVHWTGEAALALGYLVVAAVTGLVFLGETPTAATVVGFLLILVGFALLKRGALRAEIRQLRVSE